MTVGILKEIKPEENRVSMTPAGVEVLHQHGHQIVVEAGAGVNSGFEDSLYCEHGAEIAAGAFDVYATADMVMHVKEPQPSEFTMIRRGQILFTYFHLAANERLTRALVDSGSVNIAYETIQKDDGTLPLLTPMSEVAGRMAMQQGAKYLEMEMGGHGILLGGVPGVTFPASFPGAWVAIAVWDSAAGDWILVRDVKSPDEFVFTGAVSGRWYWVGMWDYSTGSWAFGGWYMRQH